MQQKSFLELRAVAQHVERMANRDRRSAAFRFHSISLSQKSDLGAAVAKPRLLMIGMIENRFEPLFIIF